jgi:hypothetical protein
MLMKWLALVSAVARALILLGCMTAQQTIGSAKAGTGYVPQTSFIEI